MLVSLLSLMKPSIHLLEAHGVRFQEIEDAKELKGFKENFSLVCADKVYKEVEWDSIKDHLKSILITSAGINNFPWNKIDYKHTPIITSKGIICQSVAEYILACILATTSKIILNKRLQKRKDWEKYQNINLLTEKKILILGSGFIAQKAKYLLCSLGHTASLINSRDNLSDQNLNSFDFIVDTLPATSKTRMLINDSFIEKLKNGVVLILVGRGQNYDTKAILESVRNQKIAEIFVDVFDKEPLPINSELWLEENIHISPHSSGRLYNNDQDIQLGLIKRYLCRDNKQKLKQYVFDPQKGY